MPSPTDLFERSLGLLSHRGFLRTEISSSLRDLAAAPETRFDGSAATAAVAAPQASRNGRPTRSKSQGSGEAGDVDTVWAHRAGVNCLDIDQVTGRL